MSDEREKVKSKKASGERTAEVAQRLGVGVDEIAVFTNPDGEYAIGKDGHRLLLQDEGRVAWYGEKAPNPTYPLVVPTVELDESDEPVDEGGPVDPVDPVDDRPKPPPKHGAGSGRDAWAAYAADSQVEVAENATRDQIIQALDEANVPTE